MKFRRKIGWKRRLALLMLSGFFSAWSAVGQETASEIKIGNITCYTGWAKEYGAVARAEAAYFQMINDRGGIHGKKIKFISVDNGCESDKTAGLVRKLVEEDGVLLLFSTLGTETNLTIRGYLNEKQVPQLFLESSSAVFDDPAHFPWTMGFFATYRTEGRAYARYILQNRPAGKIGVLSADDEAGREYVAGLREGLGGKASMIVKETTFATSDANLDKQISELKDSGADTFANFSIGPFATLAIRRTFDVGWHPLQLIPNASLSVAAFLGPAGLNKAVGIISNARSKGWHATQAQEDPAVREFLEWMKKYNPEANLRDQNNVAGYERAEALVAVLTKCGDDLSRANVMKNAASLDVDLGMLRPGIRVRTSASDFQPIKELFLIQFDGKQWQPIGPVTSQ
jgi:branched-chain amino acid transport system substrate-binding protein